MRLCGPGGGFILRIVHVWFWTQPILQPTACLQATLACCCCFCCNNNCCCCCCCCCLQVEGKLLLHVWCPVQPAPYPATPPLLALSCSQLQPPLLLLLTQQLCTAAVGLVGDPMVHELAVQLGEQLEQITAQHSVAVLPPPFDKPLATAAAAAAGEAGRSENGRKSEGVSQSESEGLESEDGYTAQAQQHAAAAEALLRDSTSDTTSTVSGTISSSISSSSSAGASGRGSSVSSSSSSSRGPRRRGGRQLSPQQQQIESRRLADYFKALQVSGRRRG
jgi:hypothetical protein